MSILSARELMETLIAFPTVSSESNLDLIDFVEKYLNSHDITCVRVPNEDGTKHALYAQTGPDVAGGVVLSGHTDVVPIVGQDWSSDPFKVEQRGDKIFGRGTCDMKGFDALAIAAMVAASKTNLKRPLQIALSYDEEVGCTGAPVMIEHMVSHGMNRAEAVIVGEPSMMKVVSGHKGGIGFRVHVHGFEVHSSLMHTGVNAIMIGAELITWANRMNEINMDEAPGELAADFVPPWTTCHTGTISGGTAQNITAKDCIFDLGFRVVPSQTGEYWIGLFQDKVAELNAQIKAVHPDAWIETEQRFDVPALVPETNGAAEALARSITGDNASNVVSYGTEAGQFQGQGYSVVICGPGDIAQAHQPDEFISVAQFNEGQGFMDRLIETLCQ